jgi:hypothetical protein
LMRPLRAQLAATMIYLKGKKENKKGIKTPWEINLSWNDWIWFLNNSLHKNTIQ